MPGRYRIFLGMAAGVGKTYSMLQEAPANCALTASTWWIGYDGNPPASREGTPGVNDGMEVIPHRQHRLTIGINGSGRHQYGRCPGASGRNWPSLMNWPTRTRPAFNTPNGIRTCWTSWRQGIDVFTTVNVQHFESRATMPCYRQITGITVHETVPDTWGCSTWPTTSN